VLLATAGALVGFVLVELAVRVATGFPWVLGGPDDDQYAHVDPLIGRIPKDGLSLRLPEGFSINIGEHGTRRNGETPPRAERPLTLAVGDSFAFGDDVNDADSWPAFLERISGRRVINAGVPGFGLDQAVLRAEQLTPIYAPDIIVVALIPHDVRRCAMSYWSGMPKPYFDLDTGALRLNPAPVPPQRAFASLKRVLAVSVTLDLLFPTYLHWQGPEAVMVHDRSHDVACGLMQRLAAFGRAHRARVIILAHPQEPESAREDLDITHRVLACAQANDLPTVNLFPVFERLSPTQRTGLFAGHLTPEGNRLVATELAALLKNIPPGGDAPRSQ
jgi:hypothetical protein